MRILNVEGRYFVQSFRDLGHEVLTIGQGPGFDVPLSEMLSLKALMRLLKAQGFQPDQALPLSEELRAGFTVLAGRLAMV